MANEGLIADGLHDIAKAIRERSRSALQDAGYFEGELKTGHTVMDRAGNRFTVFDPNKYRLMPL